MSSNLFVQVLALAGAATLCIGQMSIAQNTTSPSKSDKKFVQAAVEGGNAEVNLGKLAALKGSSEDVKQFGQKMVDDHSKLGEELREVAQNEGVRAPRGTTAKDKTLEKKLKALSGESFDKRYIEAMVKENRADLADFKREANSGNDTAIKDAASQGARVIGEHLKLAEDIARKHNIPVGQRGQ